MEAADGCEFCGAKYFVRVISEEDGFGSVEIRITHEEIAIPCTITMSTDPIIENPVIRMDMAGWEYSERVLEIAGRQYPTFRARSNVGICVACERFVVGVPLILFLEDGKYQADFCFECAEEISAS